MPASISGGIGLPGSRRTVGGPTGEGGGPGTGMRAPGGVKVSSRSVKRPALTPMITPKITRTAAPAANVAGCRVQEAPRVAAGAGAGSTGARRAGSGPSASSSVISAPARDS